MNIQPFDALAAVLDRVNPQLLEQRDQTLRVNHEAAADLQEARHSLAAHEATDATEAEVWAERWGKLAGLVKAHEQRSALTQKAAEQAEKQYKAAIVTAWFAIRDREYPAYEAWLQAAHEQAAAAYKAAQELDATLVEERSHRIAARIVPLQRMAEQLNIPASEWMPNRSGTYA